MQHRYNPDVDESHLGTTWSLDYCFMTTDDEEEDMRAIIVAYDHSKIGLWTLPVDHKGADENVIKWLVDKMEECGYAGSPCHSQIGSGASDDETQTGDCHPQTG